MTPRRLFGSLPLLLVALWGLPVLGDLWGKASEHHGEPYSDKFAGLGLLIAFTLVVVGVWVGAAVLVWLPPTLTPLQKEALAYEAARRRIEEAYQDAIRKIAEEAARRGL